MARCKYCGRMLEGEALISHYHEAHEAEYQSDLARPVGGGSKDIRGHAPEQVPAGKTGNCPFYHGGTCNTQTTAPCSWNPDSFHDCAVYKLTATGDISHLYPPGTRITKT